MQNAVWKPCAVEQFDILVLFSENKCGNTLGVANIIWILGFLIDPSPDEDRLDITYYTITGTAGAVRQRGLGGVFMKDLMEIKDKMVPPGNSTPPHMWSVLSYTKDIGNI